MKKLMIAAVLLASATLSSAATQVPLARFSQIELKGGGKVLLRQGPVQRVTLLAGSTEFTDMQVEQRGRRPSSGRLVIEACNHRCPQRYELVVEIESPDVDTLSVNGGGAIIAEGAAPLRRQLTAAVGGGGQIDLRALPASDITAAVSGGGNLLVNARDRLTAAVHGGGSIRYWGDPDITQVVQGGGRIERGR